jgi:hypothetical protein
MGAGTADIGRQDDDEEEEPLPVVDISYDLTVVSSLPDAGGLFQEIDQVLR